MDRQAAQVPIVELDLTGMEPRPNPQAKLLDGLDDRSCAPDCPGRAVERREEPVSRGIDFGAAKLAEQCAHGFVVGREQLSPSVISQ